MTWFIIALIAPLIWSIINHADKYLISKYFKGGGVGALMIFVGIISLPLSLAILFLYPDILSITNSEIFILIASGMIYNLAVLFYLYALEEEDASLVIPFWQLSPVFAYFLGIMILGEKLTSVQLIGSLITLFGAMILSIEFGEDSKMKLRKRAVGFMILSSVCIALENVIFKKASIDDSFFWTSIFWNQIGMLIFAIICFLYKPYRKSFFKTLDENGVTITSLNIFEQIGETIGIIINYSALLLAPAALITLVTYSAQPLFVFVLGIILTLLFPKFVKENLSKKHLIIKFVSIVIMIIGVYFVTK